MGFGYFFKALKIMNIISQWSITALEDGKVTMKEATDLATQVCEVLDVKLELDVSTEVNNESQSV